MAPCTRYSCTAKTAGTSVFRLCASRSAGRRDEEFHGAVLESGAVRLDGRLFRYRQSSYALHLRKPCRHGGRAGAGRQLCRICPRRVAAHQEGGIQYSAADGSGRTSLLRQFRLPRIEFFSPLRRVSECRRNSRLSSEAPMRSTWPWSWIWYMRITSRI